MRYFLFSYSHKNNLDQKELPVFRILKVGKFPDMREVISTWNRIHAQEDPFWVIKGELLSFTEITSEDSMNSGMLEYNPYN